MIFCQNDNAFLQEVLLCSRDWSCLVWKALRQPFPSSYWSTPHNDSIDSCKLIKSLSNPKHKQDCHFSVFTWHDPFSLSQMCLKTSVKYVLKSVKYVLIKVKYVLGVMKYVWRSVKYVLRSVKYFFISVKYVFISVKYVLGTVK